jgi:hypothetical protein
VASHVYAAIGLVLILFAPASRSPRTLRVLGAVTLVRGIAAPIAGVGRALAVLAFEAKQPAAVLRVGAVVALAIGGFVAFAATTGRGAKSCAK